MRRWLLETALPTLLLTLLLAGCGSNDTEVPESPVDQGDLQVEFTDEIPAEPPLEPTATTEPTASPMPEPTREPTRAPGQTRPPDEPSEDPDANELQGLALMSYERARRLAGQGQHQQAISAYREAFRKHEGESLLLETSIALAYHTIGAYQEAIRHFNLGLKIRQDPMVHAYMAQTYLDLEDCTNAIKHSDLTILVNSVERENLNSHTEANYVMATCYQQQDQIPLAVRHITTALRNAESASYPTPRLTEIRELASALNVSLTPGPTATPAPTPGPTPTPTPVPPEFTGRAAELLTYVRTEILSAEYQHALNIMAELQDLHPEPSVIVLGLRGDAHRGLGNLNEATWNYNLALEFEEDAEYLIKMAQILMELDQPRDALDYATRATQAEPASWETYHGETRFQSGVEAARLLTTLLKDKLDYAGAYRQANTAYTYAVTANYAPEITDELLEIRDDLKRILDALRKHREKKSGATGSSG